jgi:hypothetical protein
MRNWWLALFIIAAGCKHKTPEQRYVEYINDPDKKITQVIKVGNTQATLKLLTDEYRNFSDTSAEDSSGRYYYFNMRFDRSGGDKPEKEKLMYLNFDMQPDFILLKNNRDSVQAAICQRIENGKGGSYEYLLAFEKSNNDEQDKNFTIIYNDKIFGMGSVAFVYKQEDIKKIPGLKTKKD